MEMIEYGEQRLQVIPQLLTLILCSTSYLSERVVFLYTKVVVSSVLSDNSSARNCKTVKILVTVLGRPQRWDNQTLTAVMPEPPLSTNVS